MLVGVLWRYAAGVGLVRPDAADEEIQTLTARLTPSVGSYVVMIVVGLFLPTVAILGYLAIAVVLMVPFGLRKRADAAPRSGQESRHRRRRRR